MLVSERIFRISPVGFASAAGLAVGVGEGVAVTLGVLVGFGVLVLSVTDTSGVVVTTGALVPVTTLCVGADDGVKLSAAGLTVTLHFKVFLLLPTLYVAF